MDLSVISAATDVVLGHGDPLKSVLDLNFQTGPDPDLADRICMYHAALRHRFHVPVHSVVILLRPKADDPNLTGRLTYSAQPRRGKMDFRYEVIRIWRDTGEAAPPLRAGRAAAERARRLPPRLSMEDGVAEIVAQLCRQVDRAYEREVANQIITSTLVLSGLRLDRELAINLFRRYRAVEDSTTYQYIIEQGEIKALKKMLLRKGTPKLRRTIQEGEGFDRGARCGRPAPTRGNGRFAFDTAASWDELLETR